MTSDPHVQQKIIHRLKISHGHLKKVIEMAENDEYCIDIVHQSQAVQKALHEIDMLLVERYLQKSLCNDNDEKMLKSIMEVVRKAK